MGFPRQEYRSGSSFLSQGDLPDQGIDDTMMYVNFLRNIWADRKKAHATPAVTKEA